MNCEVNREQPYSLKRRFFSLKTLAAFLFAMLILFYLAGRVDLRKTVDIVKAANWAYFGLAFCLFYISILLRGMRWQILLINTGFTGRVLEITQILFLSWFVNAIIPAKLGDLYRAHLINKNYDFSFIRAFGTIFTERGVDIVVVFLLFSWSGLIVFRDRMPDLAINLLFWAFLAVAIFITIFLIVKQGGFIVKLIPQRFRVYYERFASGAIDSFKDLPAVFSLTFIIWLLEIFRLYFVLTSLRVAISFFAVVFVSLTAALLTTLPITPAGLGAVEFTMIALFASFDVDNNLAASVTILDRAISFWSIIPIGLIIHVAGKRQKRGVL